MICTELSWKKIEKVASVTLLMRFLWTRGLSKLCAVVLEQVLGWPVFCVSSSHWSGGCSYLEHCVEDYYWAAHLDPISLVRTQFIKSLSI